jgi:transposase
MRYVTLKTEEIEALELASKNADNTIRNRSHCLLLSHQRRTIIDLASIFNVSRRTIERWLDKWEKEGLSSLPMVCGRGVKTRLKGLELEVSELVEANSRNLKGVLLELEEKYNIKICKKTLQNFLKGTGLHLEKSSIVIKK